MASISSSAAQGGCWYGTRRSQAPARSSSADPRAGWGRWRCCRTGGWSPAATTTRGYRLWDPAEPGAGPVELGRHQGGVAAVAVLPDGRVVTGSRKRVLVWDPAQPGGGPVELGRHDEGGVQLRGHVLGRFLSRDECRVAAVAVLPDGRVVTGGDDGRVRLWDPAEPGTHPVELGRHAGGVRAVAVLPDGRLVTGEAAGTAGCWCGTRPSRAPTRSNSAAMLAG